MSHQVIDQTFYADVVAGLGKHRKELDCKYFYDERGSQLFDQICELDEYYLTRTEMSIMRRYASDMAHQLGEQVALVEFGSGSSIKTRWLLDHLEDPIAYMPLDISEVHLLKTSAELSVRYPSLEVLPIVGDFTEGFTLPGTARPFSHAAVYFPGSTIGNFERGDALAMLDRIARILGNDGGLLVGIDLEKDPAIIEAAYDDPGGVTADFNLNLLRRINGELEGNFELDQFRHKAIYSPRQGRVEIYLVSTTEQRVNIGDSTFHFEKNEHVFTEYSHKYTIEGFAELASVSGFTLHDYWTDEDELFAVLHLVNERCVHA